MVVYGMNAYTVMQKRDSKVYSRNCRLMFARRSKSATVEVTTRVRNSRKHPKSSTATMSVA